MKPATTQDENKTAQPTLPDNSIASAAVVLTQIDEGRLNAELGEAIRDIVAKCQAIAEDTRRDQKGLLTMKLGFLVSEQGTVTIAYEVAQKTPKRPVPMSLFWIGKSGQLTLENPRQQKLSFREISGGKEAPAIDLPAVNTTPKSV